MVARFHAGAMVRAARVLRGVKQKHLADKVGLAATRLAEIERSANVETRTLVMLAEALGFELGFREKRLRS